MTNYIVSVSRSIIQFQSGSAEVEANSKEEAIELVKRNPEDFDFEWSQEGYEPNNDMTIVDCYEY